MKLSTIQRTIRLAFVTLLSMTVVVACGPDKRKHRAPMKVGQKGIDPKTGLPIGGAQTPEQQKKAAEDLKNRSANISNIEGRIAQAKNGQPTDKNSMGDGEYILDGVTTYFKYMNTSNNSGEMRVYREHGVQNAQLTDIKDTNLATGFIASFSDTPRFIDVPLKFKVDRTKGQDWASDPSNFPSRVLVRTNVTQNTAKVTHELEDSTQNADPNSPLKAGVINLLNFGTFKDNAYSISDDGKNVTMRLLKVSDSMFKISFDIDESAKPLKARTVVLTYKVEKKAAAGGTPTPTGGAAQPSGTGTPATTTGDTGGMTPAEQPPAPAAGAATAEAAPAASPESAAAAAAPPAGAPAATGIPGVDDDQSGQRR